MADDTLPHGALTERTLHLCVDMQNMFAEDTDWHTPWMPRVLPVVERIAHAHPDRTIYTRFIPPERPEQASGTWRRYYERWRSMTRERLDPRMLELVPSLAALVPPGVVVDKPGYSAFERPELEAELRRRNADALIVTGTETDVCVLATVLGAVDRGWRVVIPTDAICSSSDRTHDALLTLYRERYGQQIETATTDTILRHWR